MLLVPRGIERRLPSDGPRALVARPAAEEYRFRLHQITFVLVNGPRRLALRRPPSTSLWTPTRPACCALEVCKKRGVDEGRAIEVS